MFLLLLSVCKWRKKRASARRHCEIISTKIFSWRKNQSKKKLENCCLFVEQNFENGNFINKSYAIVKNLCARRKKKTCFCFVLFSTQKALFVSLSSFARSIAAREYLHTTIDTNTQKRLIITLFICHRILYDRADLAAKQRTKKRTSDDRQQQFPPASYVAQQQTVGASSRARPEQS